MLFCSLTFFYFFVTFIFLWELTPNTFRKNLIILGSLFFYGYWNWSFLFIPVLLTAVCCYGAVWISKASDTTISTLRLFLVILLTSIPLILFKYLNFFTGKNLITAGLPLGISFITFTLIAYVVDVYKKEYPAEKKFSWLLCFIVFFPQLIAGPILRPSELLPQLKKLSKVSLQTRIQAISIFTIGLAKKLIIADQLKPYIDHAFQHSGNIAFQEWLIAAYGFSAQIYCDFSGYSDMAIGLALFFGMEIPVNFKRPFLATSISMLWRRWHITLSNWFRDYIYFPIKGHGKSPIRKIISLILTMSLCGLWHGAGWTYILWGFLNGIGLSFEYLLRKLQINIKLPAPIKILITFHWWTLTALIFRSQNLSNAFDMIKAGFHWSSFSLTETENLIYPFFLIILFYATHFFDDVTAIRQLSTKLHPSIFAFGSLMVWLVAIVLSSTTPHSARFIYFDF